MNQTEREALVAQILAMVDYRSGITSRANPLHRHPAQGQMVVTGPSRGTPESHLGFCVQVRRGCGQFSSDMVFLRHANGLLTTHENQAYFPMSEAQIELARPLFKHLPEEEDYSEGYKCCDKVHALGFLIENSDSKPMANTTTPVHLVVKSEEETTFIAII